MVLLQWWIRDLMLRVSWWLCRLIQTCQSQLLLSPEPLSTTPRQPVGPVFRTRKLRAPSSGSSGSSDLFLTVLGCLRHLWRMDVYLCWVLALDFHVTTREIVRIICFYPVYVVAMGFRLQFRESSCLRAFFKFFSFPFLCFDENTLAATHYHPLHPLRCHHRTLKTQATSTQRGSNSRIGMSRWKETEDKFGTHFGNPNSFCTGDWFPPCGDTLQRMVTDIVLQGCFVAATEDMCKNRKPL